MLSKGTGGLQPLPFLCVSLPGYKGSDFALLGNFTMMCCLAMAPKQQKQQMMD
jgi:hypothetical protein